MRKRYAILAALVTVLGLLIASPAHAATVRIMPLGDSITGSPGCWRALLWNRLQENGYTDIDFVGTLPPQGCGIPYDGDNEGHGGALVTDVADRDLLPGWLAATRPDIVMMHFGTNDVWSAKPTATILAAYGELVDQMRASNPTMKILVAQIIPLDPPACPECARRAVELNQAIPGWAASKTTPASPIVVVDQWTGFDTATDTYDGVHPNASGDRKIADRWYPALAALLSGTDPGPTPGPTPTTPGPSPSPSPTPAPGPSGCTAAYRVVNEWPGGFQGEVTVENTGDRAISGWTVTWTFPAGQQVTQAWNATVTQQGADVTAKNAGWNGALRPGGRTSFGFLASAPGSNPAPTPRCTAS